MIQRIAHLAMLCVLALATACSADDGGSGSDTSADAGIDASTDASGDAPSGDTAADAAGPECDDAHPCGIGSFCKTGGVCCPALGCAPNCPNGRALDAKGCETCGCVP